MEREIIKTSEAKWVVNLSSAYKKKKSILFIDDAKIGINPETQTIFQMGKKAGLSTAEWTAVGVSIGISASGIWMIIAGIGDPEPTSKLGLLIGGGAAIIFLGGFSAIRILTKYKPPNVKLGKDGFEISWD